MKTLLFAFALTTVGSSAFAGDWSFNYLKKLYIKDADRCYKRCESLMNWCPGQESAWFFAMKIEIERVAKNEKVKVKSTKMNRAVDLAKYFDKNASADLKKLTGWDTVQPWLKGVALDVRQQLDEENLSKNIKQLDERWKKYAGSELEARVHTTKKETTTVPSKPTKETKETEITAAHVETPKAGTKLFTGMPTGTENIASADAKAEKELVILINKERKRLKMDTLIWNPDLARACRYHAMDMGTQDYFDHNSYDMVNGELIEVGETFDRIGKFYSATFVNSENIAAGNSTAAGTYDQWFNSPGHYANMFNPASKYVGIGVAKVDGGYGYYWAFCTARK